MFRHVFRSLYPKQIYPVSNWVLRMPYALADLIDRPTCHNIYDENKGCANGFMCSTCGHAVEDYEGYRVLGTWNYCPNCGAKVLDDGE